jgi:hypothetical protein
LKLKSCLTLALAGVLTSAALAQQYILIDLTPADASATATSLSLTDAFKTGGAIYPGSNLSNPNAAIWSPGSSSDAINLHPAALFDMPSINGFGRSIITGTTASIQVGYASGPTTFQQVYGVEWNGTADSAVVLPIPFANYGSQAFGVGGNQIVGYAYTQQSTGGRGTLHFFAGPPHAMLWDATTHAVIDLHNGAQGTVAVSVNNGVQVGYGGTFPSTSISTLLSLPKAMMWHGSRDTFVWLHPATGYQASEATATDGIQQAGWAQVSGGGGRQTAVPAMHAMVWTNTAASFVDLHPFGFVNSFATGVAGGRQVGYATNASGDTHAIIWSGSLMSSIDLNSFTPPGFIGSAATSIDASGNISGYIYSATQRHAVVWAVSSAQ